MLKQYRQIDEKGLFVADVLLEVTIIDNEGNFVPNIPEENQKFFISADYHQYNGGFYKPLWNGNEWVEGKSTEEIEEFKSERQQPISLDEQNRADIDYIAIMLGVDL